MIRQPVGHCRRPAFQAAMLPTEIVMGEHQAQRCPVISPAFREAICQSAHPFAKVPDAAIHALRVARANLGMFRLAKYHGLLETDYPGRRILTAVFFDRLLEYLDDRAVVNSAAHEPANPERIRTPSVGG